MDRIEELLKHCFSIYYILYKSNEINIIIIDIENESLIGTGRNFGRRMEIVFKAVIMRTHGNQGPKDQSVGNLDGNADAQGNANLDWVVMNAEKLHKSGWKKIPAYLAAAIFGAFLLITIRIVSACFPEIWGGTIPASFTYSLKDLWGFVLIFAASCFFVLRVSKSNNRTYSQGGKIREMILLASVLILVIFVNPVISQPLERFHLFTVSTILLTGVLILLWLIVLILAGVYQLEYKAIFGTYFHRRSPWNKSV